VNNERSVSRFGEDTRFTNETPPDRLLFFEGVPKHLWENIIVTVNKKKVRTTTMMIERGS